MMVGCLFLVIENKSFFETSDKDRYTCLWNGFLKRKFSGAFVLGARYAMGIPFALCVGAPLSLRHKKLRYSFPLTLRFPQRYCIVCGGKCRKP